MKLEPTMEDTWTRTHISDPFLVVYIVYCSLKQGFVGVKWLTLCEWYYPFRILDKIPMGNLKLKVLVLVVGRELSISLQDIR